MDGVHTVGRTFAPSQTVRDGNAPAATFPAGISELFGWIGIDVGEWSEFSDISAAVGATPTAGERRLAAAVAGAAAGYTCGPVEGGRVAAISGALAYPGGHPVCGVDDGRRAPGGERVGAIAASVGAIAHESGARRRAARDETPCEVTGTACDMHFSMHVLGAGVSHWHSIAALGIILMPTLRVGGQLVPVRIADTFISRFLGVWASRGLEPVLLLNCRSVHSFGLRRSLQVIFFDRGFRVISVRPVLRPWRIAFVSGAAHVLESPLSLPIRRGEVIPLLDSHRRGVALRGVALNGKALPESDQRAPRGVAFVEALMTLPLLLFIGFVVIQIGLLWHAKYAVIHAVHVAARHASVHHGSDQAIRDGVIQGLMPFVSKADDVSELPSALFRSASELALGQAMGWIRWEVLSPTRQSFVDWGSAADPVLSPGSTSQEVEIPAVGLMGLTRRRLPFSGVRERVGGLPVGVVSGQTLVEANNLKINLRVGVPLQLPVAGRLLARSLSWWSGCGWSLSPRSDQLGLISYGAGADASLISNSLECRALAARDIHGKWQPRWPVEASAVIQMQSNARRSGMVLRDRQSQTPVEAR